MATTHHPSTRVTGLLLLSAATAVAAASCAVEAEGSDVSSASAGSTEPTTSTTAAGALGESSWLGDYTLTDEEFGTDVTVTVAGDTRTIESNVLPNHETGEFPNEGNPNEITEQSATWTFPSTGTWVGAAREVRTIGVAVNGVKFEPGTAETVTCASGETYRVEAIEDTYDLGLDFNNAHVQPNGEYHYHGVSELLVESVESGEDLVLVGFAADGYLMYYSLSGAYSSSYALSDEERTGAGCEGSFALGDAASGDLEGTTPDGTYTTDYVYTEGSGELDECNGVEIDGQYVYLVTDEYPFVPRCLNGEVSGP